MAEIRVALLRDAAHRIRSCLLAGMDFAESYLLDRSVRDWNCTSGIFPARGFSSFLSRRDESFIRGGASDGKGDTESLLHFRADTDGARLAHHGKGSAGDAHRTRSGKLLEKSAEARENGPAVLARPNLFRL